MMAGLWSITEMATPLFIQEEPVIGLQVWADGNSTISLLHKNPKTSLTEPQWEASASAK